MSLDGTISLLANWLESRGAPLPVLGYSQGARVGLLLALDHPELVSELVLVSGSPGIRGTAVRTRRREADDTTATRIEAGDLDEFLDGWLTQPLTSNAAVSPDAAAKDRAVRSENTPSGLAAALRGLGQGAVPFVGDRLRDLPMRLLTIAGARDLKYRALAMEMAAAAPHGSFVIVDSAGHNVVLEQPQALAVAIAAFLAGAPDG